MKKINTTVAANVVGGIAAGQCEETYMTLAIGGGAATCQLVTTCADKKGNLNQTFKATDAANCAA